MGRIQAFTCRRPQMTCPTPPTVVGFTITRAAEPWQTSSFGHRNVFASSQAPLVACILTCGHVSGRCTECARNLRRVRYDAFGLRGCLAACTFYVQKKDTSRCQTRAHPPGTAHLRLCACVFVQATDWQQQWCNEFSLAWCMLGLLLCSFASCASLSSELLRVRASVARDGPWRAIARCLR